MIEIDTHSYIAEYYNILGPNLRFLLQSKNGTEMIAEFSLEDLLLLMKNHNTAASGNEAKRTRRSWAASSSDSGPIKCHVGFHSDIFSLFYSVWHI